MPYARKSTRSRPYRKRYTRRQPTLKSLAKKVNKLTSNASRYVDYQGPWSAGTTAQQYCVQYQIGQGDGYNQRDSNNTYTRKLYIDLMAQANDPEANIGRLYVICVPDGTAPTAPATVHDPISPMTTACRQYVLYDYKFSMGAFQTQSANGTSTNSYFPWHRLRRSLKIPRKFQHNWYQETSSDAPTNSIWVCFLTDSAIGNCPCLGNVRTYFTA